MKKDKKANLGLTFWCTIILFLENITAVGIATVAVTIINSYTKGVQISSELLVFLFSLVIGISLAFILNRAYLQPMRKIYDHMGKVAKGDFSVRIKDKVRIREIDDIYSNFNIMVEELGEKETVQSDFVSNISHEFKTPITAIEGYSMLLQGCNANDEQKLYIEKILFNTHRLSTLVGDILLLSKLDNQSIQPKRSTFSLDEQIRQAILMQEIKWSEKEITLDVDIEEVTFSGTEALLLQVWNNLLSNAIKFSPKGGIISIKLSKNEKEYLFKISDQGPGIEDTSLKYIFDKFYQADGNHKSEGCGLGLTLAKRIVDINSGNISVKNLDPCGCEFLVRFPIKI